MPKGPGLPSKEDLLRFLKDQPGAVGKRELARAFHVKGAEKVELKRMLRELAEEGAIEKKARRARAHHPGRLPPVALLEAKDLDAAGDLLAAPTQWDAEAEEGPPPKIVVAPGKGGGAVGVGDRFLARMRLVGERPVEYEAKVLKKIGRGARRILAMFREGPQGGRLVPVDKRSNDEFVVAPGDTADAADGDLVEAEVVSPSKYGLAKARVLDVLGDATAPRAISLIAIHEQGIPIEFPEDALAEAQAARPPEGLGARLDLRDTPLITIDPEDARDHDDAVFAAPDDDPANPGGWVVWVAIADVAAFVTPGGPLDRAARLRGNSAYFPDRVVPMLPDELSGDLCSLHEGVDRPCLAVRMRLRADGTKRDHSFHRALMRSAASLTYEQAQAASDGRPDTAAAPLLETVITPLFEAYHAARRARDARSPLELDLPERKVILNEQGDVESVRFRDRFDAHRLIEEFMILANVCAAETLEAKRARLLYRVHEEPNPEKIEALREVLKSIEIPLAKGQVMTPRILNRALEEAGRSEHAELVNMAVLRAQTQAYYAAENFGHFGLALQRYAHFTSPIRRYADLCVHRALIRALGFGLDGQTDAEADGLPSVAEHISMTERRAMTAERDTVDRYLAAYLAERRGAQFDGRISGVQRFGLFVKLDESGADGLVPIGSLGDEYFRFDEAAARLIGERSGVELQVGQAVRVRLVEATPVTGGMIFELLDLPNARGGGRRSLGGRGGPKRRISRVKLSGAKAARKQRRKSDAGRG